jgi:hypothetical protein
MATVCVTVPDEQAGRIVTAVAAKQGCEFGTMEEGIGIVQEFVFAQLSTITVQYEAQAAADAIRTNTNDPLVSAVVTQGEG